MKIGPEEITTEEEWCSEQRSLSSQGKPRGVLTWYRVMREAEGQVETRAIEITEKVFDSDRKAVAAKDVAYTIEQRGEIRE